MTDRHSVRRHGKSEGWQADTPAEWQTCQLPDTAGRLACWQAGWQAGSQTCKRPEKQACRLAGVQRGRSAIIQARARRPTDCQAEQISWWRDGRRADWQARKNAQVGWRTSKNFARRCSGWRFVGDLVASAGGYRFSSGRLGEWKLTWIIWVEHTLLN